MLVWSLKQNAKRKMAKKSTKLNEEDIKNRIL